MADSRLDLPEGWKKGAPCSLGISDQDVWENLGEAQPTSWSLGIKRNVAIELAAGEIIAHFDDDDLYLGRSHVTMFLGCLVLERC